MKNMRAIAIDIKEVDYFYGFYCVRESGHCYRKNSDFTLDEVKNPDLKIIIKASHYLRMMLDKFMLNQHDNYIKIIKENALRKMSEEEFFKFRKVRMRKDVEKILMKNYNKNKGEEAKDSVIDQYVDKILAFDFGFGSIDFFKQYYDVIGKDLQLTNIVYQNRGGSLSREQYDFLRGYDRKSNQKLINTELRRICKLAQNGGYSICIESIKEKIKSLLLATIIFLAAKIDENLIIEEKIDSLKKEYLTFHYKEKEKPPFVEIQQTFDLGESTCYINEAEQEKEKRLYLTI